MRDLLSWHPLDPNNEILDDDAEDFLRGGARDPYVDRLLAECHALDREGNRRRAESGR